MEATLVREQTGQVRPSPVVAAQTLRRRFGAGDTAVEALREVSLEIPRGHLTAVMGPSGSGKSTLMHILAGLDRPTTGTVEIDGIEITALKDTELTKLRRRHIGFVFQFFNLLPMLTAEENVTLPLAIAGDRVDPGWLEELLAATGLEDRRTHRPSELSGGQQQRVAVARALISRPTVLFADEPTGNLDSQTSSDVLALLRNAVDTYGQTTVMVTHDPKAAAIADRILFLADGEIVRELGSSLADRDPHGAERGVDPMRRVAFKGLLGRKVRTALTAIAIVLGVAMVSGTFVLTDSVQRAFDTIFTSAYDDTDAVITGSKVLTWSQTGRAIVPSELLGTVRGAARGRVGRRHDPRPLGRREPGVPARSRAASRSSAPARASASASTRRTSASARSTCSRATGRPAPVRS